MRLDWFMGDLSLGQVDEDLPSEVMGRLAQEAEAFLRAGGQIPWCDWQRLNPESQEAFRVAGDRIRREQAALHVLAMSSSEMVRAFLAGDDVEDASVRVGVKSLADRIVEGLGGAG